VKSYVMIILIVWIINGCTNGLDRSRIQTPQSKQPLPQITITGDQPVVEEFSPPKHNKTVQDAKPDTLKITRKNPLNQPNVAKFDKTITEPKDVLAIYQKLIHLPLFPNGIYHCPNDGGVTYHFKFSEGKVVVMEAEAIAAGCQGIHTSDDENLWSMEPKGDGFWSLIAIMLNLTDKELRGVPFP
jgi:hypothetical protein